MQPKTVKLLNERVNLESKIEALEKQLSSQHIEFPPAEQATVGNFDTYYQFNEDKIKQLEERRKQLEKIKPPQPPQPPQPPLPPKRLEPFFSPQAQPKLNPVQVLNLYNEKKKIESEVEALKKLFPNVRLPQFKNFPGATIEDVIRKFEEQKAILETAAALANPPTPPHNLTEINADKTIPAQIPDEFLPPQLNPNQNPDIKCDELYDYQKSIQKMSRLSDLTIADIPDSNDYSHAFVKKINDGLIQTILNLKKNNAKTLPKTTLDKLLKEIQAEINRIKCPKRGGGKTLRRRQMKTTRTRTLVPREKGLRKRATIGQKKQKVTRTRN
jgi:hypothetical protein